MQTSRSTQVAIVGAGPSGLLLGHVLGLAGIDTVVIERQSADHVAARIRAGVLEDATVSFLNEIGLGTRMQAEGLPHDGFSLIYEDTPPLRIDLKGLTGRSVMVYGQTEVTRDLMQARKASGAPTVYEASSVAIHDFESATPSVSYSLDGVSHQLHADFVIGCDGYHGVCRAAAKATGRLHEIERTYPFGWLGLLADVPPVSHELIYANHADGFYLCSMRSPTRSRYYLQCSLEDRVENWSDDRFWAELARRLGPDRASALSTGPSLEKSIAPLRSFVAEPLQFGRLFLAGDAGHIVPPTGAKGLNLAVADIRVLSEALITFYTKGSEDRLNGYSELALARIWKAERFSWWMTSLLHKFDGQTLFDRRIQAAEFNTLASSHALQTALAEAYLGIFD
ncbi:MAG: 4-hydroxybenzoate 3-monooxygenase [Betaproteobacteria bacterium]|jgi:p-hydroxybenzoate 3-monooxygenase|nr:4-hydroxybenzoate 3-monooxygenase [Betaproteobacteria bacterium]